MCSKKKRDGRGRLRELEAARAMVGLNVIDFVIIAFQQAHDADARPMKPAFDFEAVQGTATQYERNARGNVAMEFDPEVLDFMKLVTEGRFKSQRQMLKVRRPQKEEQQAAAR